MIGTRAVGQELQDQFLGAARKGRERVTSTVKTVTATAQHIRPQLPNLPKPNLSRPTLPTPAQLREKAPALVARLPKPQQLMSGAQELAGRARSVQRLVLGQVRTVAAPFAHQAARLAGVGTQPAQPAQRGRPETTTRVSEVKVASSAPAKEAKEAREDDAAMPKNGRTAAGQPKARPKTKSSAS